LLTNYYKNLKIYRFNGYFDPIITPACILHNVDILPVTTDG